MFRIAEPAGLESTEPPGWLRIKWGWGTLDFRFLFSHLERGRK